MQKLSFSVATAIVSLAVSASFVPAQATSVHVAPAMVTSSQSPAGVLDVGYRWDGGRGHRWRGHRGGWDGGWRHGSRGHHPNFGLGFALGLGLGAPFVGYPYAYNPYPPVRAYPVCPYAYRFDGYACVPVYYRSYHYGGPGGLPLDYRERRGDW